MRLLPATYEQILQGIIARMVTLSSLSDVGDAAVLRHLAAGVARAVDQAGYQTLALQAKFSIDTAQDEDLDQRAAEIQPGTITRFVATGAAGNVVFSRGAQTGTVNIKADTQVTDAVGNVFATQAAAIITPTSVPTISGHLVGQDSALVPIQAVLPGSAGNVGAGTIVSFVQRPTGVDAVTNPAATTQGSDKETDDAFRARLKAYVASLPRSTPLALETAVLGQRDPDTGAQILFSAIAEDVTHPGYVMLYVDDGTGTAETVAQATNENMLQGFSGPPVNTAVGGEKRLNLAHYPVKDADAVTLVSSLRGTLVRNTDYTLHAPSGLIVLNYGLQTGEGLAASYTYYTGIVALAQRIVDGDATDPTDYPGIRAAGVSVTCLSPLVVAQPISCVLSIADGYDAPTVRSAVQAAILNYINALPISGDLLRAGLYQAIMAQAGVLNTVITAPANDVAVGDGQIARCLPANVTVN